MTVNFKFRASTEKSKNPESQKGSIQGRVHFDDSTIFSTFPTKIYCTRKEWDSNSQTLKKKQHSDNMVLNNIRTELHDLFLQMVSERKQKTMSGVQINELTPKELISVFNPKKKDLQKEQKKGFQELITNFLQIQKKRFEQKLIKVKSIHSADFFKKTFTDFLKNKKMEHTDPNNFRFSAVSQFADWLLDQKYAHSSINIILSHLKSAFICAVNYDIIKAMPFMKIPRFKTETKKPANPLQKLETLMNLKLDKWEVMERFEISERQFTNIEKAYDLFMLQCFTGFSYDDTLDFLPDLHTFEKNKIKFINKRRGKTNEMHLSVIYPEAQVIFDKYQQKFPKFKNYHAYCRSLKIIGEMVGFLITSHLARKLVGTFLTVIKKIKNFEIVKMALAHNINSKITSEVYFDVSDLKIDILTSH